MGLRCNIRLLDQASALIAHDIWALFQRAYQTEAALVGTPEFPPLNRSIENIRSTEALFYGLFENGTLIAVSETQTDGECLAIDSFIVDPQFFRKGFGSCLLRFILDESGCDSAAVATGTKNEPAIRFYRKFGFNEIDRWEAAEGMQIVKLSAKLHDYT